MSTIQAATQAEVAALNKALIQADKSVQGFAQGDPKSDEVGTATDTDVESVISAAQDAGYSTVPDGSVAVKDGDTLNVLSQAGDSAQASLSVTAGALTGAQFSNGTDAIVSDGQTFEAVEGGTVTVNVAQGVVTVHYAAA